MLDARRLSMLDARAVSSAYYLSVAMYLQDRVMPLPIKGLPMKGLPTIEPLD